MAALMQVSEYLNGCIADGMQDIDSPESLRVAGGKY